MVALPIPLQHWRQHAHTLATSRRVMLIALASIVVTWSLLEGAHDHGPVVQSELSALQPDRSISIDASTGVLDLSNLTVAPGEIVDLLLDGTAGAPHQFVLTGAPAADMDVLTDADGDTIIRLRVPEDGQLSFLCTIPGHEGLHGNLVVTTDD